MSLPPVHDPKFNAAFEKYLQHVVEEFSATEMGLHYQKHLKLFRTIYKDMTNE